MRAIETPGHGFGSWERERPARLSHVGLRPTAGGTPALPGRDARAPGIAVRRFRLDHGARVAPVVPARSIGGKEQAE